MRFLLGLIGLALLAVGAGPFRARIPGPWQQKEPVEVSQAAAASADEKLARLRDGGETVRLSDVEFTSYLRYRFDQQLAGQLEAPTIDFEGEQVTLSGRFPTDRLPDSREVRAVKEFLPDTAEVSVAGGGGTPSPRRRGPR